MSQPEILEGLRRGNQNALAAAFDQYGAAVYGVVLRIVGNQQLAEEVTQDVFLKLWNKWDQFDAERGKLLTWLLQIARNTAIDYTRKGSFRKEGKTDPVDFSVSNTTHPSEEMAVDAIGLKEIVERLDTKSRTILELAYFKGMTQTEIEQHLDLPLGTVKTRMRKALKELRKIVSIDRP
ncbi:MAG: sigma-70 family RNA polymerase sigma factor [Bacteroidetes bacterium]|nr:MAG: sigma-70 family RNA polymerase sigma factor [Bacteroidota bacterium]